MVGNGNGSKLNGIKNKNQNHQSNAEIYSNPIDLLAKQGIVRCQDLSQDEAWGRFAFRSKNQNQLQNQLQSNLHDSSSSPSSNNVNKVSQQGNTFSPSFKKVDSNVVARSNGQEVINQQKGSGPRIPDGFGGFVLKNESSNSNSISYEDSEEWKVVGSGRKRRGQGFNSTLPKNQQSSTSNSNGIFNQNGSRNTLENKKNSNSNEKSNHPSTISLTPGQFLSNQNQNQNQTKKINHTNSLKNLSRSSLPALTNSFNRMVEKCHLSPKIKSTSFSVGEVRNFSGSTSLIGVSNSNPMKSENGIKNQNISIDRDDGSDSISQKNMIIGTKVSPFGFGFQLPNQRFQSPQNFHFPISRSSYSSSSSSNSNSQIRSQGSFSSSVFTSNNNNHPRNSFQPNTKKSNHRRNVSNSTSDNLSVSVYSKSSKLSRANTLIHIYDSKSEFNGNGKERNNSIDIERNELGAPFTLEDSPYSICLKEVDDTFSVGSGSRRSFTINSKKLDQNLSLKVGEIWNGNSVGNNIHSQNRQNELRSQNLIQLQAQNQRGNQMVGNGQNFNQFNGNGIGNGKNWSYAAVARLGSSNPNQSQIQDPRSQTQSSNVQKSGFNQVHIQNPNQMRFQTPPRQQQNLIQSSSMNGISRSNPQFPSQSIPNPSNNFRIHSHLNPYPNANQDQRNSQRCLPQSLIPSSPSLTVASNSSTAFLNQSRNSKIVDRSFPMHGTLSQTSNDSINNKEIGGNGNGKGGLQVVSQVAYNNRVTNRNREVKDLGKISEVEKWSREIAVKSHNGNGNGNGNGNQPQSISRNPNQTLPFQAQRNFNPHVFQPNNFQVQQQSHQMVMNSNPMNQTSRLQNINRQRVPSSQQPSPLPSDSHFNARDSSRSSTQTFKPQNQKQVQTSTQVSRVSTPISSNSSTPTQNQIQNNIRKFNPSPSTHHLHQMNVIQNYKPIMNSNFTSSPISMSARLHPGSPLNPSFRSQSNLNSSKTSSEEKGSFPNLTMESFVKNARSVSSQSATTSQNTTPRMIQTSRVSSDFNTISSNSSTPKISQISSTLKASHLNIKPEVKGVKSLVKVRENGEVVDDGERSEDEAGKLWRSLEKKLGTNLDCGPVAKKETKKSVESISTIKEKDSLKKKSIAGSNVTSSSNPSSIRSSSLANRRNVQNIPKPIEITKLDSENQKRISEPIKSAPLLKTKTYNQILENPIPQSAGHLKNTFSSIPSTSNPSSSSSFIQTGSKTKLPPSRIPRPIKRIQNGTSKMAISIPEPVKFSKPVSNSTFVTVSRNISQKSDDLENDSKKLGSKLEEEEIFVLPCQLKEIRKKSNQGKILKNSEDEDFDSESILTLILSPRRGGISISSFENISFGKDILGKENDEEEEEDIGAKNLAKAFADAELELGKFDLTLSRQKLWNKTQMKEPIQEEEDSSSGDDFSQESGSESSSDDDEEENQDPDKEKESDRDSDDELNQIVLRFSSPIITSSNFKSRENSTSTVFSSISKKSSNSSLSSISTASSSLVKTPTKTYFKSKIPTNLKKASTTNAQNQKPSSQSIVSLLRTDSVMKKSEMDFSNDKIFRESGDYVKVPTHWSRRSWKERKEIFGEKIEE